jgi:hypothetical protein
VRERLSFRRPTTLESNRATVVTTMSRPLSLRLETAAFLILSMVVSGGPAPSIASQTPAATTPVRDIDGHRLNLVGQDTKAEVLFFITTDCPIANSYLPEINRIVADYAPRKIAFYAVYTDPAISIPAIRRHAHDFGLGIPLIPDTKHDLVHRVGATVTPEVAVLNREESWFTAAESMTGMSISASGVRRQRDGIFNRPWMQS